MKSLILSYSAHPLLLASDDFASTKDSLKAKFPLKNLHWKPLSRPAIRTIQAMDISLRELGSGSDGIPGTKGPFQEGTFVNLYFVQCDDHDQYKNSIKGQIRDWVNLVQGKKHQEWLIVQLAKDLPASASKTKGLFQIKGSIADKIRGDFNVGKKDRVVVLNPTSSAPETWTDLTAKIKEGLISSFDAQVIQREEEIKEMEGQRLGTGFNFCEFFLLKESLAHSFEGIGLLEDALFQYDELEAIFFQVLKERGVSYFGKLITTSPSSADSDSILSMESKPYREMIKANSISIFDFRVYLFARQSEVLVAAGRVNQVASKGINFIRELAVMLEPATNLLPTNFLESWIYSQCVILLDTTTSTTSESMPIKGELYQLALTQLVTLGLQSSHLIKMFPFPPSVQPPVPATSSALITNKELLKARDSKDSFDSLFIAVAKRTIDCLGESGKSRAAMGVKAMLASLDYHRGRIRHALDAYLTLFKFYSLQRWPSLELFFRGQALDCQEKLQLPRGVEWMRDVIEVMKLSVETNEFDAAQRWVGFLREAGTMLEKEMPFMEHPAFQIEQASEDASPADGEDGCVLRVKITNFMSFAVSVDDVRVCLSGKELEQLWFTSGIRSELKPGENIIPVSCAMPVSGLFALERSQVRISRLAFHYIYTSNVTQKAVFRIKKDRQALNAKVAMPVNLRLDVEPAVMLHIFSGRNELRSATVNMKVPENELVFIMTQAKVVSGEVDLIQGQDDETLLLEGIRPECEIILSVPYHGTFQTGFVTTRISIDYYNTTKRPKQRRAFRKTRDLRLALPIAVNVQDIFRPNCLFSKFTISSDGRQYVRVKSASLEVSTVEEAEPSGEAIHIQQCQEANTSLSVGPKKPASFLFKLSPRSESAEDHSPLKLTITYRPLPVEIAHILKKLLPYEEDVEKIVPNTGWENLYLDHGLDGLEFGNDKIEDALDGAGNVGKILDDCPWMTLSIPVDVPIRRILCTITLKPISAPPYHVGQSLLTRLTISSTFLWSGKKAVEDNCSAEGDQLYYDFATDFERWLVSGKKKSSFVASSKANFETTLTLIPVQHGSLFLPRVAITSSSQDNSNGGIECYLERAAERIEVLPSSQRSTFVISS